MAALNAPAGNPGRWLLQAACAQDAGGDTSMTETEIIAVLHEGFRSGAIPKSLPAPVGGDPQRRETIIVNGGGGQQCTACRETIPATEEGSVEYRYPHVTTRFHRHCAELWEAERHTPPRHS
jgi:hypothetical protein